jgi:endo-1,4-beta-xylanase
MAKSNNQKLRCHTLVWWNALPAWVTAGNFDSATLQSILWDHITAVVQQYKGRCYSWDVVNEAINDDGSYRSDVFYNTIGEQYIAKAFLAASQADPNAKLYYNDFNLESATNNAAKIAGVQRMVDMIRVSRCSMATFRLPGLCTLEVADKANSVQANGGRIDGVGIQGHFNLNLDSTPVLPTSDTVNAMNAFVSKNLDVAITELDVSIQLPAQSYTLSKQQAQFTNVVAACKSVPRCAGVTVWDFTDRDSWTNQVVNGLQYGSACIWDTNLNKKQGVYQAILSGWGQGWAGRRSLLGI